MRGHGHRLIGADSPDPYDHAMTFAVKPLDVTTWPDFAALAEDHHGVWDGCWCLGFHEEGRPHVHTPEERRALKEMRVRDGRAHAALVFDGDRCVGWCQFGPTDELPRIKHQKAYQEGLGELPDWRITCFFVGKNSPPSRGGPRRACRRAGRDRSPRRRERRELSRRHDSPQGLGIIPQQRDRGNVRARRLYTHSADRQAPMGRQPNCRLTVRRLFSEPGRETDIGVSEPRLGSVPSRRFRVPFGYP